MIVDLQGVGNVLTDPQIHCLDKHRFGKGNLGYEGILMFFNTHTCNEYCKTLGLVNPRLHSKLPDNFELVKEIEDAPAEPTSQVNKLCDLCRKGFKVAYQHYVDQRSKGFELWCNPCTKKRNESMKPGTCCMCGAGFKSSAYWFQMKKTDFPDKCSACRLANRDRMRRELEGDVHEEEPSRFSKKPKKKQQKFEEIVNNIDMNFPCLQ